MRNRGRNRLELLSTLVAVAIAALLSDPAAHPLQQSPLDSPSVPVLFARTPHVASGRVAFTYAGDVWTVAIDGSDPRRVTSGFGTAVNPRFSPDGAWIAFSSDRRGNLDVYMAPATGGEVRQLTWHSASDLVQYWTGDGSAILFSSQRKPHLFAAPHLYLVSPEGSEGSVPRLVTSATAATGMLSQDGNSLVYTRGRSLSAAQRNTRGTLSNDVFVLDVTRDISRQLTDPLIDGYQSFVQDVHPMWGADGLVYFSSERSGSSQIWRTDPAGVGAPVQVTRHLPRVGWGVRNPAISPDGKLIAYELDYTIWLYDVDVGESRRLELPSILVPPDLPEVRITGSGRTSSGFFTHDAAVSRDGRAAAISYHGDIFIVPVPPENFDPIRVNGGAWHERDPLFSPDGTRVAYISDHGGEEQIWIYNRASRESVSLTTSPDAKHLLAWSPDGLRLAFTAGGDLRELRTGIGILTSYGFTGFTGRASYSPDGSWLVYSRDTTEGTSRLFLLELASGIEHRLAQGSGHAPAFTTDGQNVVYVAEMAGFNFHLFLVPLTPWEEAPTSWRYTPSSGGSTPATQVVQPQGLPNRGIQLSSGVTSLVTPLLSAEQSYLFSADGRAIYFLANDRSGLGLFSIDVDGGNRRRLGSASEFSFLHNMSDSVFVVALPDVNEAELHLVRVQDPAASERMEFTLDFAVDRRAEWRQMFAQLWRETRDGFYDPAMHGVDWEQVRSAYEPLIEHLPSAEDLYALFRDVLGELHASHMGVTAPPNPPSVPNRTRHLGLELNPMEDRYRISYVYRAGPADREWLDVEVGDLVLAMDGRELRAGDNYWRDLTDATGETVTLRLSRGNREWDATIRPVLAWEEMAHQDRVLRNRELVAEWSGGRVAYVRLPRMGRAELDRFSVEATANSGADAMIVDIRYNPGGNISHRVLEILSQRPHVVQTARGWEAPVVEAPAIAGPIVLLIRQNQSDAELLVHGFKTFGLGRVVGGPTSGSVIRRRVTTLVDGSTFFTPWAGIFAYNPASPDGLGFNLEGLGIPPDVFVRNSPADEISGHDSELRQAVLEALQMLADRQREFRAP